MQKPIVTPEVIQRGILKGLNPEHVPANVSIGTNNQEVYFASQVALDYRKHRDLFPCPIRMIIGASGTGKTAIAQASCFEAEALRLPWRYLSGEAVFNSYLSAYKMRGERGVAEITRALFKDMNLVWLDDADNFYNKEEKIGRVALETLGTISDYCFKSRVPLFLNVSGESALPSLKNKIEWTKVRLAPPGIADLRGIVSNFFKRKGLIGSQESLEAFIENTGGMSLRETLEETARLQLTWKEITKTTTVTSEDINLYFSMQDSPMPPERIKQITAEYLGVKPEDVFKRKTRQHLLARNLFTYLTLRHTPQFPVFRAGELGWGRITSAQEAIRKVQAHLSGELDTSDTQQVRKIVDLFEALYKEPAVA